MKCLLYQIVQWKQIESPLNGDSHPSTVKEHD